MVNENLSTKYILLNCLRKARESGTVVSGEIIAAECGISRTAVWKAVQALESFGYKISSDASGYLLQKDLEDSICPWEFGTKEKYFSYFQTTDSTMIQAQKVATSTKKISDVKVIVADKQTKGMGQHGRLWKTTKGSLAFTLVTKNSIPVVSSRRSVMACQIAIANVLSKISKRDFFVRWPNDVWSESGKVCGILDELCSTGGICSWQNLGIGVNVFTHPNIAFSDSVFPKQQKAIRRKIISDFITEFEDLKEELFSDTQNLERHWNSFCSDKGKDFYIKESKAKMTFMGMDSYGSALFKSGEVIKTIPFGSVSFEK